MAGPLLFPSTTMISYHEQDRTLNFGPPNGATISWQLRLTANDHRLGMDDAEVQQLEGSPWQLQLRFRSVNLTWLLRAEIDDEAGLLSLYSTLANNGETPISLGAVWPFCAGKLPVGPDAVYLPGLSGQQERMVRHVADPESPVCSKVKNQYFDSAGPTAIQVGFTSFLRADTEVRHRATAEGVCDVAAQADFAGWQLAPGANTPVETFTLQVGSDPHAQLNRWAEIVATQVKPRQWESPPLGWLGVCRT